MAANYLLTEGGSHFLLEGGTDALIQEDSGGGAVTGTIAVTVAGATSAITANVGERGTIAVTVSGATSAITANVGEQGTIAVTVAGATSVITANVGGKGTLAITAADATSAISAFVGERGTAAVVTGDATSAISGTFTPAGGGGGTDPGHGSLIWPYRPQQRQPAPTRRPHRIIHRRPYAGPLTATASGATATFTAIFDISQLEDEELLLDLI